MTAVLGRNAATIRDLAAGIDPRPVTPDREAKSISSSASSSARVPRSVMKVVSLEMLCLKVSSRMKAQNLAGGRVTLKLKRPDHSLLTRSQTLAERTDKAHVLFAVGRELLAREIGGKKRYRLLGIGADQLGPPQGAGLLDLVDHAGARRSGGGDR